MKHTILTNDGFKSTWINGDKHWYRNGKPHRIDGPATTYASGDEHWYLNGYFYENKYQYTEALNELKRKRT